MSKEEISHVIKAFRKEKGLTQTDLARQANVSLTCLRDIEQCKASPNTDTLERIGKVLGLKVTMVVK